MQSKMSCEVVWCLCYIADVLCFELMYVITHKFMTGMKLCTRTCTSRRKDDIDTYPTLLIARCCVFFGLNIIQENSKYSLLHTWDTCMNIINKNTSHCYNNSTPHYYVYLIYTRSLINGFGSTSCVGLVWKNMVSHT